MLNYQENWYFISKYYIYSKYNLCIFFFYFGVKYEPEKFLTILVRFTVRFKRWRTVKAARCVSALKRANWVCNCWWASDEIQTRGLKSFHQRLCQEDIGRQSRRSGGAPLCVDTGRLQFILIQEKFQSRETHASKQCSEWIFELRIDFHLFNCSDWL